MMCAALGMASTSPFARPGFTAHGLNLPNYEANLLRIGDASPPSLAILDTAGAEPLEQRAKRIEIRAKTAPVSRLQSLTNFL